MIVQPINACNRCRKTKTRGRLGIVSMSKVKQGDHPSLLDQKTAVAAIDDNEDSGWSLGKPKNAYIWMHRHFPQLVDCQPIDVEKPVNDSGFQIIQDAEIKIWTIPVAVVVAKKTAV